MKTAAILAAVAAASLLAGCAGLQSRVVVPLPAACQAILTPLELEYGWGQTPSWPGIVGLTIEDAKKVSERVLKGEECAKAAKGALGGTPD